MVDEGDGTVVSALVVEGVEGTGMGNTAVGGEI